MPTFLLYDDALRSLEVRHEVAELVVDPIIFIDHDGERIVVGSSFEEAIFEQREDVVDRFWNYHELGAEDLMRDQSFPEPLIGPELVLRALRKLGESSVRVPSSFAVVVADYLRDRGVDVVVDADAWSQRRRRKTPWEIEGIERAQRAAETAMLAAARMLREAEPTSDGLLRFEGEILTAELAREAMVAELVAQGAESENILIQSGDACLAGHDVGHGPILPDRSCVIDCYPRDRRSGAYADMTRTFVPGTPSKELTELHSHCLAALEIALEAVAPGRKDAYERVVGYFESHGYPTRETHSGSEPLREGFLHSLGHGVGLEVHEKPWMGSRSNELLEGDVVAIEPGLYFAGVGGVRIEDTVLVTDYGVERFTDPFPYDLEP